MKVSIKSFVSLCAIYFLTSGLALAQVVIDFDGFCTLYEEVDGELTGVHVVGDDKVKITTSSANGNINLTCSAKVPAPNSGRSVVFNYDNTGRYCNVSNTETDDWHQVTSANGNAKLTCHLKD